MNVVVNHLTDLDLMNIPFLIIVDVLLQHHSVLDSNRLYYIFHKCMICCNMTYFLYLFRI